MHALPECGMQRKGDGMVPEACTRASLGDASLRGGVGQVPQQQQQLTQQCSLFRAGASTTAGHSRGHRAASEPFAAWTFARHAAVLLQQQQQQMVQQQMVQQQIVQQQQQAVQNQVLAAAGLYCQLHKLYCQLTQLMQLTSRS